jgi:hypothetical protein
VPCNKYQRVILLSQNERFARVGRVDDVRRNHSAVAETGEASPAYTAQLSILKLVLPLKRADASCGASSLMACQCQSVAVLGLREGRVCLVCLCSFVARSRRSAPFVYLIVMVTDLLSSNSFSEKLIKSSLYGLYQTDRWESDRKQLSTSPSRDRQDILIARAEFQAQPRVTYDGSNMCQERQLGPIDSCKERRERRYGYLTSGLSPVSACLS